MVKISQFKFPFSLFVRVFVKRSDLRLTASFLSLSRDLLMSLNSFVKPGENFSETRLFRIEACFSRIIENTFDHCSTIRLKSPVPVTTFFESTFSRVLQKILLISILYLPGGNDFVLRFKSTSEFSDTKLLHSTKLA